MIKIESKKHINIISKDGNRLGSKKRVQINKFELKHRLNIDVNLYFKSIEDLEEYKDENIWCVGCIYNVGIFIISDKFTEDFEPIPVMTVNEAIATINLYHNDYKLTDFVLIKSVGEFITIPKIDF